VSRESVKRGLVSGLGRTRRGGTDLFGGAFTIRTGCWLHSGRPGGTLSVGPEPIMEIPARPYRVSVGRALALKMARPFLCGSSLERNQEKPWR
jgi:hypothetical protein